MKQVLFVDRDADYRDAIQRVAERSTELRFTLVSSAEAAVVQLASSRFDVVVTDLRLPGMDGASLLRRIHELHPTTARIVFVNLDQLSNGARVVPLAQQFIAKPCAAADICAVIERTCALQDRLESPKLRRMIGEVRNLPSVPRMLTELLALLNDPRAGVGDIAAIIEQDLAMSAKILQLANSAAFGRRRNIANVRQAVSLLGFTMIKNMVFAVEVFRSFSDYSQGLALWIEALQEHSLLVGRIAAQLFPDRQHADDAFIAGMLHDTGKLLLAMQRPKYLKELLTVESVEGRPMHAAELELEGVTHAELGGHLLGLWGLPYPIVEAVAYHHLPTLAPEPEFDIVAAVYVANLLAHEVAQPSAEQQAVVADDIDLAYLLRLGVADRLPDWRAMAAEQAAAAPVSA